MTLKKYTPQLLLTLLVFLVCWPALSGDFIFDDHSLVKDNPYVRSLHSLSSYLTQEDGIVGSDSNSHLHTGFYRPLLNFSYFIDYKIWGMKAFGFKITNIFLHLCCCLLLYSLLIRLQINKTPALLGAIFFAIHPVHTETISMIVCRNNLLATLFSFITLQCYIHSQSDKQKIFLLLASASFCLAILSKEIAVMIIPVLFLYNRLIRRKLPFYFKECLTYLPFLFLAICYMMMRKHVIGDFLSPFQAADIFTRLYFIPYIIAYNFKLIFLPFGLHSFYIKYPEHYLGYEAFAAYIFVFLLITTLWIFRRKSLLLFSVLSFLVALFPVIQIIPIASMSIITLRWLYFPLAFLSIAVAYIVEKLLAKNIFITISAILAVFIYLGTYSFTLNDTLWKNQKSFLTIEVLHFKNSMFFNNLAGMYLDEKKYMEAETLYLASLDAFPKNADTYINYSVLLLNTGRADIAAEYLKKAKPLIVTNSTRCQWFNSMGVVCDRLQQKKCARDNFVEAVKLCPDDERYKRNLRIINQ